MKKHTMQNAAKTSHQVSEPIKLKKRVGSTTFVVHIHFTSENAETIGDKVLRLIDREVEKSA